MDFSLRICSHPAVWTMRRATSLSESFLFHYFCLQARRTGCTEQPSHMSWVWWSNRLCSSNGRIKQCLHPDTFLWPSEFASGNLPGGSDPSLTAGRLRVCNIHLYNSCDFQVVQSIVRFCVDDGQIDAIHIVRFWNDFLVLVRWFRSTNFDFHSCSRKREEIYGEMCVTKLCWVIHRVVGSALCLRYFTRCRGSFISTNNGETLITTRKGRSCEFGELRTLS